MEKSNKKRVFQIIGALRKAAQGMTEPASVTIVKQFGRDPFLILISCLLSLRAKDTASLPVSLELFNYARTPEQMLAVPIEQLEKILFTIGFYRRKAQQMHSVSHELIERFASTVPNTEAELLSLKGVGRKTANLVLGMGFGIPAICVDIHVHRISNRLGLVQTTTPEETEVALKELLPSEYWIEYNHLLVQWGQNICVPVSPKCSECVLAPLCPRVGVTTSR